MTEETFILHEYDFDGSAKGPLRCSLNELEGLMASKVAQAKDERRKLKITDSDDHLVFHTEGGEILFPTRDDVRRAGVRNEA